MGRVVDDSGTNLMLQFWLKRRDVGTKHCREIKGRRRTHLGSMRRQNSMARLVMLTRGEAAP
jgi:hypothetical protein